MRSFAQKRPVNDDVHDGEFCLHYVQIGHRNKPYDVWEGPYIEKDFIDVFFSVPQCVMDGLVIVLYCILFDAAMINFQIIKSFAFLNGLPHMHTRCYVHLMRILTCSGKASTFLLQALLLE